MYRRVTSSGRSSIVVIGDAAAGARPVVFVNAGFRRLRKIFCSVLRTGTTDRSARTQRPAFDLCYADVPDWARARRWTSRPRSWTTMRGSTRRRSSGISKRCASRPHPPADRVEHTRASRSFPLPNAASFPPDSRGDRLTVRARSSPRRARAEIFATARLPPLASDRAGVPSPGPRRPSPRSPATRRW